MLVNAIETALEQQTLLIPILNYQVFGGGNITIKYLFRIIFFYYFKSACIILKIYCSLHLFITI